MFVAYFSAFDSLRLAQQTYYDRFRFADVFVTLNGPARAGRRPRWHSGVARVTARSSRMSRSTPGRLEPATGRLISLPSRAADFERTVLRRGPRQASDEVTVSEVALAHHFVPGTRRGHHQGGAGICAS
jgi:putative ABC transport system permease protein